VNFKKLTYEELEKIVGKLKEEVQKYKKHNKTKQ